MVGRSVVDDHDIPYNIPLAERAFDRCANRRGGIETRYDNRYAHTHAFDRAASCCLVTSKKQSIVQEFRFSEQTLGTRSNAAPDVAIKSSRDGDRLMSIQSPGDNFDSTVSKIFLIALTARA